MSILDDLEDDLGINPGPLSPEETLVLNLTESAGDRYQKIYNCQYWLKHELRVYIHLREHNYLVCKTSKEGRQELDTKTLTRTLLKYYFQMTMLPRFKSAGGREESQHKLADLDKFLDLIMERDEIKKVMDNPDGFI